MSGLTEEQRAEIERQVKAAAAEIDAKYTAKAHQFRDWINAHPVAAARVIGTACLLLGFVAGASRLGAWARALL
jgi:hypothetical protein